MSLLSILIAYILMYYINLSM